MLPHVPDVCFWRNDDTALMMVWLRSFSEDAQKPASWPSTTSAIICTTSPPAEPCGLEVVSAPYCTADTTRRLGKFFLSKSSTFTLNDLVCVSAISDCGDRPSVIFVLAFVSPADCRTRLRYNDWISEKISFAVAVTTPDVTHLLLPNAFGAGVR